LRCPYAAAFVNGSYQEDAQSDENECGDRIPDKGVPLIPENAEKSEKNADEYGRPPPSDPPHHKTDMR
jgi:hypothetical protein